MKPINISKKSIAKAQNLFGSIDENINDIEEEVTTLKEATDNRVLIEKDDNIDKINDDISKNDFSFQNLSQNLFKTAAGDDCIVSQEAFNAIKLSQSDSKAKKPKIYHSVKPKQKMNPTRSISKTNKTETKKPKISNDSSIWIDFKPE